MFRLVLRFALGLIGVTAAFPTYGQNFIQIGPFGRPISVADEFDQNSIPLPIYSTADVDFYIPDVTRAGWITWARPAFQKQGTFIFTMYMHFKTQQGCLAYLPVPNMDERKKDCRIIGYEMELFNVNPPIQRAVILRVMAFRRDTANFPVLSADAHESFAMSPANNSMKVAFSRSAALIEKQFKETATRDSYPTR